MKQSGPSVKIVPTVSSEPRLMRLPDGRSEPSPMRVLGSTSGPCHQKVPDRGSVTLAPENAVAPRNRDRLLAQLRTRRPEGDLVRVILQWLAAYRILAWRTNTGAARLPRPGGGSRFVRFGPRGHPDIAGVLPGGRALYIEVKRPGQRLRTEQIDFLARLERAGAVAFRAESMKDVALALVRAGVRTGLAPPGDGAARPPPVPTPTPDSTLPTPRSDDS